MHLSYWAVKNIIIKPLQSAPNFLFSNFEKKKINVLELISMQVARRKLAFVTGLRTIHSPWRKAGLFPICTRSLVQYETLKIK